MRLLERKAFAQSPQSRLRRTIGHIEISEGTDVWLAEANSIIMEVRDKTQRLQGGRRQYKLVQTGDEFRTKVKRSCW